MYQFVFYKGAFPPFTLVMSQPYEEISQSSADRSIVCYKDVLLHVNKEEYDDVDLELLEYFATPILVCQFVTPNMK